jgi:hypothetical protein
VAFNTRKWREGVGVLMYCSVFTNNLLYIEICNSKQVKLQIKKKYQGEYIILSLYLPLEGTIHKIQYLFLISFFNAVI